MEEWIHRTRMPSLPAKIKRDITPECHKVVMFQIKLDLHFFVLDLVYKFHPFISGKLKLLSGN
jgi:hypothetical protein